ncbi:glycosyltransferase family 4 protein [Rhodanobacter sp. DHG33]|uniref:glycosyltransferase family 4 protein n=1 Tax=Rhodanobacter sp. DHG33 TaxID=2775921 RepID=UPI001786B35F|nr:glycosyltransferase family 4 protein [Rhodanobacter sp. DHG33]MBD8897431.1 glycosyltransferase family 4 protein [Rhodanobacter sp. DHG33]
MTNIWFWQNMISPHMAALAIALARMGCRVTYVAAQEMSEDRARLGWQVPQLPGVDLRLADSAIAMARLANEAPGEAIHLVQGIRGNGLVGVAQAALARRSLQYWVMMESLNNAGLLGGARQLLYRSVFYRNRRRLAGVLAIGRGTSDWVRARGVLVAKIFPFAYFLEPASSCSQTVAPKTESTQSFTVLFAGQFIDRKRLDLLIDAMAALPAQLARQSRLQVIGNGPLDIDLRAHAERCLGNRLQWAGRLYGELARQSMAAADCLVLPSRHDGWGAVVSEALMAGTPVICSDTCGASEAVLASGVGGVFRNGDIHGLVGLLSRQISLGPPKYAERLTLANWARSLGSDEGARYLLAILSHAEGKSGKPEPPWKE